MALYLYLRFDALQLDNLLANSPDGTALVNLPCAVVDNRHQLVQLNLLAQQQGLKVGMSLGSAAALCHNLQVVPLQLSVQQQNLSNIAKQLYNKSADIALDPPDGLYLRLCNMLSLYQGLTGYWQALHAELALLPYRYVYSCGATPYAAKCLARQRLNLLSTDPAELEAALRTSPLTATELDDKLQQQLQRLGIYTLQQLFALEAAELSRRFDSTLLSYLGRLRGEFYHPLQYIEPAQSFSRFIELLYDIKDTAVLTGPLGSLLQQLQQQLCRANALCYQLTLTLYCRDADSKQLGIGSAQGEYDAKRWMTLCQLQLQRLQLTEPATGIKLEVAQFFPQQNSNAELFTPQAGTMTALQLVSVLQARLGCSAVSSLCLQNQFWPEQTSRRLLPLMQGEPLQQGRAKGGKMLADAAVKPLMLRPAFMLPSAKPLHEAVTIRTGPERLCPDGWQLDAQRDYFVGRNANGQWLWLYRTAQQRWFVHGLFS